MTLSWYQLQTLLRHLGYVDHDLKSLVRFWDMAG
jgi:hypothetical protein